MKTLVFGSLNIDYVYSVDHIVKEKETSASLNMQVFCGGKGMNQAIAFAKANATVCLAGRVGEDGSALLEECKKNNIDISGVVIGKEKSGHTVIQVDQEGQNAILLYGGSNQTQQKEDIDKILNKYGNEDYLVLQNEINELSYIIDQADARGMKIILNPSPYNEIITTCDLQKIDYFIINEVEGFQMTGKKELIEILDVILKTYKKAAVVLTLGEQGAYYKDHNESYFQPAIKTKVIDTTGAGDTFTGYFFAGLQKGMHPKEALLLAAKAAAIAVSKKGAAGSIPYLYEVIEGMEIIEQRF